MSNKIRNYKDNVFCLLYREKKYLLSLYNAMNGTAYDREEELEVVTLNGAICMQIKNDAAFVIDSTLNLYEQQSTVNPNMPLRNLYYVAEELKRIEAPVNLYHRRKVKIPSPRFVVFYNGVEEQPERQIYCLSDLYAKGKEEPELELKVTVLNINRNHNKELLESCESLRGYMAFVEKVRNKRKHGITTDEAVEQSVKECIFENILPDFFGKHKEEIMEMSIFEFDQELYEKALKEDMEEDRKEAIAEGLAKGRAEGLAKGSIHQLVKMICRKLAKGKFPATIALELDEELDNIEHICKIAERYAPEYNIEMICGELAAGERLVIAEEQVK